MRLKELLPASLPYLPIPRAILKGLRGSSVKHEDVARFILDYMEINPAPLIEAEIYAYAERISPEFRKEVEKLAPRVLVMLEEERIVELLEGMMGAFMHKGEPIARVAIGKLWNEREERLRHLIPIFRYYDRLERR